MSRSRLTRRRTLLRFGAAAAVTAMALGAVGAMGTSATATQGQAILAGQYNDEGHSTDLVNTGGAGANGNGLVVSASTDAKGYGVLSTGFGLGNAGVKGIGGAKAYGVYGESLSTFGVGVHGEGEDTGVEGHGGFYGIHGTGPFGVTGESTASGPGVSGTGSPGVEGLGTGSGSIGLYGHGEAFGVKGDTSPVGVYGGGTSEGLHGFSDSGIGVYAVTNGGIALHVEGPLQLSRSGRATIAGSSSDPRVSVKVSNVALSPDSSVLATLQKHAAGVYRGRGAEPLQGHHRDLPEQVRHEQLPGGLDGDRDVRRDVAGTGRGLPQDLARLVRPDGPGGCTMIPVQASSDPSPGRAAAFA